MQKNILILLMLFLPLFGFAQKHYKLIEKTPKNKPAWLTNGNTFGAFIIQASKVATLEEAQNDVMMSLLNQVASSIAVQVIGEMEKNIDWTVVNLNGKSKEQYIEEIRNNTTVRIAKMPALQGFSITKADVYWERYRNKKTKEYCYDYYIRYPFSSFELDELISAYNAQDKLVNDEIDNYKNILEDIENVDVMLENINMMKTMMQEYGEEDIVKYNKLKNNISLYEKTIGNIYIEVLENTSGKLVIQLKCDDKVLKTKLLPQLKGECARDFVKKHNGNQIEINFNTFDCFEQDDNYIEIKFTFGKKRITEKVLINL
jgi:hypothetical protein